MVTSEKITLAALGEFYRNGFHASGVDQLARAAGVTKRTLYAHYASKDELMLAVLRMRHEQFIHEVCSAVERQPVPDRPLAYLEFIASWCAAENFCGCLFINACAEFAPHAHGLHQQAQQHKQELRQWLQKLCHEAGCARSSNVADTIFLLGEGLIVSAQTGVAQQELQSAALRCAKALLAPGRR